MFCQILAVMKTLLMFKIMIGVNNKKSAFGIGPGLVIDGKIEISE